MAFSKDGQYLIAVGVEYGSSLCVYEISSGKVLDMAVLQDQYTNKLKVDPNVDGTHIQFITLGNNALLNIWRFDTQNQKLSYFGVPQPDMIKHVHFLTADFTGYMAQPTGTYLIVIGDSEGALVAYD